MLCFSTPSKKIRGGMENPAPFVSLNFEGCDPQIFRYDPLKFFVYLL